MLPTRSVSILFFLLFHLTTSTIIVIRETTPHSGQSTTTGAPCHSGQNCSTTHGTSEFKKKIVSEI